MQIAASALFLTFALLFNAIELICSDPRTLKDLFPGFNGVMPPVEEVVFIGQFLNFSTFGNKTMNFEHPELFKRAHIIFGWKWGELIQNPSELFDWSTNEYILFDTNNNKWVAVPRDLLETLGVGRHLSLVVARDEAAARHLLTSNDPAYKEAHRKACRYANQKAETVEFNEAGFLHSRLITAEEISVNIKREYTHAYNLVFASYLHHHGEYNLHGHRPSYLP